MHATKQKCQTMLKPTKFRPHCSVVAGDPETRSGIGTPLVRVHTDHLPMVAAAGKRLL